MKKDSSTLSSYNIDDDVISKIARLFARQNGVNISFSEVQEPIINKNSIIIPASCKKWAKDPEKVSLFRGFLDLQIWKLRTLSLIKESFDKKEKVTPSQDLLNAFIRKSKTYNKITDTVNVENIKFRVFSDSKTPDLSLGTENSFKKFVSDPSIVPALKYIFDIFEVIRIENWAGRSSFLGVKQNIQNLHAHTFMNRKKFDSEIMESLIQMALSVYFKPTLDWNNFNELTKFSDMSSTWISFYNPYFSKLANELRYAEDSYNLSVSLLLSCFEQFEAPDLSDPPPPDPEESEESEEPEDDEDNKDSKDSKKDNKNKKDSKDNKNKEKDQKNKEKQDKKDSEKQESSEEDSGDDESNEEGDVDESEDGEKQESDESSSGDAEEGQSDAQDQESDSSENSGKENDGQEKSQGEGSEGSEESDSDNSDSGNEDSPSNRENQTNSKPQEKEGKFSKEDLEKLFEDLKKAQSENSESENSENQEESTDDDTNSADSNYKNSTAEKQKNKPLKDPNDKSKKESPEKGKEYELPKFNIEELKKQVPSGSAGTSDTRQLSDTMQIFTDQSKVEKIGDKSKNNPIFGAPPEILQRDKVIQVKDIDEVRFKNLKDNVGKKASVVSNKMKNIIRVLAEEDEEYDKQYGDLDEDSLAEVATKNHAIYYKTNQGTNHNNIAWFFLVDLSGSMGGQKCELAIQSLLTCCQAIYDAGNNKFFVAGFDNGDYRHSGWGGGRDVSGHTPGIFSRREVMNIYLVKKIGDDWNKVKKTISSLRAGGSNGDGDALKWAISRLLEVENVSRRELIVFSDGEPSCHSDDMGLLHKDLVQTIKRGRELGVGINSVGIMHNTSRFYGAENSLIINKIDELPEKFTKMIRSVMLGSKSLMVKRKSRKYN